MVATGSDAELSVDGDVQLGAVNLNALDGGVMTLSGVTSLPHSTEYNEDRNYVASGSGSRIEFPALTVLQGGTSQYSDTRVRAESGGVISMPVLDSIVDVSRGDNRNHVINFVAEGNGSEIELSSLTKIHDWNRDRSTWFSEYDGGNLAMGAVETIIGAELYLEAPPTGPLAPLGPEPAPGDEPLVALRHLEDSWISLSEGDFDLPVLTAALQSTFDLRDGVIGLDALSDITGSTIYAGSGALVTLPAVTRYTYQSTSNNQSKRLEAAGEGTVLSFPNLEAIEGGSHYGSRLYLEAIGGATLDLSAVESIAEPSGGDSRLRRFYINAESFEEEEGDGDLGDPLSISTVDLSSLRSIVDYHLDGNWWENSVIQVNDDAEILLPSLEYIRGVQMDFNNLDPGIAEQLRGVNSSHFYISTDLDFDNLDFANGTIFEVEYGEVNLSNLIGMNHGAIYLYEDADVNLDSLMFIDGVDFDISGGARLRLPSVTAIRDSDTSNYHDVNWVVSGNGSRLELPNVRTITGSPGYQTRHYVTAEDGGEIDLSSVRSIQDIAGDNRNGGFEFRSHGDASMIDLSDLRQIIDLNSDQLSVFEAAGEGTIQMNRLTNARGVNIIHDGTGNYRVEIDEGEGEGPESSLELIRRLWNSQLTLSGSDVSLYELTVAEGTTFDLTGVELFAPQITSLRDGSITARVGSSFLTSSLTNIDGTSLDVSGGVTVSFPGVTHYRHASGGNYVDRSWRVDGVGSRIELPNLQSIVGGGHYDTDMTIRASGGGVMDLSSLQQVLDPRDGDTRQRSIQIGAEGNASLIDLSALTTIADFNTDQRSWIDASGGGTLVVPLLTDLIGTDTWVDTAGDLSVATLELLDESNVEIDSMPSNFASLESISSSGLSLANTDAALPNIERFNWNTLTTDAGATIQMPAVTNIDGSEFRVYGGTQVALPQIESYDLAITWNYGQSNWEIDGEGSKLDLSGLKWIRGGTAYQNQLNVTVSGGGELDMSGVEQIVDRYDGDTRQRRFSFTANGAGSEIAFDSLRNIVDRNGDPRSFLTESSGGRIFAPSIVTLVNTDINGDVADSPIQTATQSITSSDTTTQSDPAESDDAEPVLNLWVGGDGNWTEPSNWSEGSVPGIEDDVVLPDAGVTITISGGGQVARSINGPGNLQITGGSLTVYDHSDLTGALTVTNGATLAAAGEDAVLTASGLVDLDGANLTAIGGAQLHFPTVTEYSQQSTGNYQTRRWFVEDVGSRIVFNALQTITGGTHYEARLGLDAFFGGQIDMPVLTSIIDPDEGDIRRRRINLVANGRDSLIDAPLLTTFTDQSSAFDGEYSSLEAISGGAIWTPALETLAGVRVSVEAESLVKLDAVTSMDRVDVDVWNTDLNLSALESATYTRITATDSDIDLTSLTSLERGSVSLGHNASISSPSLSNIDGTSLAVSGGASLHLPLVTSYDHASTDNYQDRSWTSDGLASWLSLPNLVSITGGGHYDTDLTIAATAGGWIDLSSVTEINDGGGDTRERRVRIVSDGIDSEIQLDALTSFGDVNTDERSQLIARHWGTIHAPLLETLIGVEFYLDGAGQMQTANLESVQNSHLNLNHGIYDFSGLVSASDTTITLNQVLPDFSSLTELHRGAINVRGGMDIDLSHFTNIDGVSLSVFDGSWLDLSGVTEYDFDSTGNYVDRAWTTRGAGSFIDLSGVTKITGGTNYDNDLTIEAHAGAGIDLSNVTEIVDGDGGDTRHRSIQVIARDRYSHINLRSLTRFQDSYADNSGDGQRSSLVATHDAYIQLDSLTTLDGVRIEVDATGASGFYGLTSFDHGEVSASGTTVDFPDLLTAHMTNFVADNATINLPQLTSLTGGRINLSANSVASLPVLTTLDGTSISVADGIELELPGITTYSHASTGNYQSRQFIASGNDSLIRLPNLMTITGGTHYEATLRFEARDGGGIDFPSLTSVTDPNAGDTRLRAIHFVADGPASRVDLPLLESFVDVGEPPIASPGGKTYSTISASRGGQIDAGSLVTIQGVQIRSDETSGFPAAALQTATNSVLDLTGTGDFAFDSLGNADGSAIRTRGYNALLPVLTSLVLGELSVTDGGNAVAPLLSNVDGARLLVTDGVTLSLPAVTSITHTATANDQRMILRSEGYGSVLDLGNVTELTGGSRYNTDVWIEALSGGLLDLSGVTTIARNNEGDQRGRNVEIYSEGFASKIDLSALETFDEWYDAGSATVDSLYGGSVDLGSQNPASQTNLTGVYVTVNPDSSIEGQFSINAESILSGRGIVEGDVIINGLLAPDGAMQIIGNLLLDNAGTLEIDITGVTPVSDFDVLDVSGFVEFLGTVHTVQGGGYQPAQGDTYLVMTFADKSGTPTYEGLDFGSQLLSPELSQSSLELIAGFSSGAAITNITPSDSAVYPDGPFLIVEFDEPIDPDSFTPDDVSLTGPGAVPITIESIEPFAETANLFILRPDINQYVDGTYSITIGPDILDLVGNVMNQDDDFSNGEPVEDQFNGTFDWALPNLELVGGNFTTPETTYSFGGEIALNLEVTNSGASVAGGNSWRDRFYLSSDMTLDAGDMLLESVSRDDPLAVGESYPLNVTLDLPLDDVLAAGTYYLIAAVDSFNWISESDESNTYVSGAIDVTFPPLVDLTPTAVTGPTAGQPRQSVVFTWEVTNQGDQATATHWYDRVYLESVDNPSTRYVIGTVLQNGPTSPGESYVSMMTANLPDLADGDYRIQIVSDYSNRVFEGPYEGNNSLYGGTLTMTHPDVEIRNFDAPDSGNSGEEVEITWDFLNSGTATADSWQQRVFLSDNQTLSGDDRLVDEFTISASLDPGQSRAESRTIRLPVDLQGSKFLLLVTDTANQLGELSAGENNNVAAKLIELTLSPFADLAVSDVTAPILTIGDPAEITVGWTVTNEGIGRGFVDEWTDAIVLSENATVGDSDDVVVATFDHTGGLDQNASYTRSETFRLPIETNGRFTLFVRSDFGDFVFENGLEANNDVARAGEIDIMPAPYADLVVDAVDVTLPIAAGGDASLSWTVRNAGIGVTNRGDWYDRVYLSTTPDLTGYIDGTSRDFQHFGQLAPDGTYVRSGSLSIPEGLSGDHYLIVLAARRNAPFEFLYDDNNLTASAAFPITLLPPPDLVVTSMTAPTEAQEGTLIDIQWSVENSGLTEASGGWTDRVYLQEAGNPDADLIQLGQFPFLDPIPAGQSYSRSERIRIPTQTTGTFNLFVKTNFNGALYEGAGSDNNTTSREIVVNVLPRPDLQVESITIPDRLQAGATLSPEFVVVNQGAVGTGSTQWVDRVYLSLDTSVDHADVLIGELPNSAALAAGDRYSTEAGSVVIPLRYRGDVYVLAVTDASDRVSEWPNNNNNLTYQSIYIEPEPLADLVVSDVVAPSQVVAGSTIPIRYTVTNLGSGATHGDKWAESVWLTRDKNRPHPGQGDFFLKTLTHDGSLDRFAGYETETTVKIPRELESGTWYITPWVDPFDVIPEDTLAANTNPDDPNNFDNNNYKARAIDVLGSQPDLVVSSVIAPATAAGGDTITVTWTVDNLGLADADPGGWLDRIYLSDMPDPKNASATTMLLGEMKRDLPLAKGASYTESMEIALSPSATGQYIIVITDDDVPPEPSIDLSGFFPQIPPAEKYNPVDEVDETNNATAVASQILSYPANLKVVEFDIPDNVYSGEEVTFSYTVENIGTNPVWGGTRYWKDFIWLSADDEFFRRRASFLGTSIYAPTSVINPGDRYTIEYTTTLPEGTGDDYSLWVHLDAHNDRSPLFFPYQARLLETDWYPANQGDNASWLSHFDRWAYEDPSDNLARADFPIIYQEADLTVTDFQVPAGATSGDTIQISYTVENIGNRETRVDSWTDRLFISHDASLDNFDHEIGSRFRTGTLKPGETYTGTIDARIPDGIEGDFSLMLFTDSAARRDRARRPSNIGFELIGIEFETPGTLAPWDLASEASRESARGKVKEYQLEGNNIAIRDLPVTLAPLPDLQVTEVTAPLRADRGQEITVEFTVTNLGGDTVGGQEDWFDLVYLSRDQFLDLSTDVYLGSLKREGGLDAGESYSATRTVSLPSDLLGPYYVFVITDPDRSNVSGDVFEGPNERNNSMTTDVPTIIELPPPTDLQVTDIIVPADVEAGSPATITWTVTNTSTEAVTGRWSDSVFFSSDATWDLGDAPAGRLEFRGTLGPGESYTQSFETITPSLTPGAYRAIVRADIFNQVYEDVADSNNTSASPSTMQLTAPFLTLDVPLPTTLGTGPATALCGRRPI